MIEIKNTYFKLHYTDPDTLISGCHLPNPDNGPFSFENCTFHPAVREFLKTEYYNSIFIDCNIQ